MLYWQQPNRHKCMSVCVVAAVGVIGAVVVATAVVVVVVVVVVYPYIFRCGVYAPAQRLATLVVLLRGKHIIDVPARVRRVQIRRTRQGVTHQC